jgi:uncharacterized integral membrane protein
MDVRIDAPEPKASKKAKSKSRWKETCELKLKIAVIDDAQTRKTWVINLIISTNSQTVTSLTIGAAFHHLTRMFAQKEFCFDFLDTAGQP